MEMINYFLVFFFIYGSVIAWVLICSRRTYKQRMALLQMYSAIGKRNGYAAWKIAISNFDRVHYFRHEWHLLTFRDPAKLYDRHESAHQVPAHEA